MDRTKSAAYVLGAISAAVANEKQASSKLVLRLLERLGPEGVAMYRRLFNRYPKRLAPIAQRFRTPTPGWLLGAAGGAAATDLSENYLGD